MKDVTAEKDTTEIPGIDAYEQRNVLSLNVRISFIIAFSLILLVIYKYKHIQLIYCAGLIHFLALGWIYNSIPLQKYLFHNSIL